MPPTVFPHTVLATNKNTLSWAAPVNALFVRGDLALVSGYAWSDEFYLLGDTSLDISDPASSYYLGRLLGCASYQTTNGAEPARDAALP